MSQSARMRAPNSALLDAEALLARLSGEKTREAALETLAHAPPAGATEVLNAWLDMNTREAQRAVLDVLRETGVGAALAHAPGGVWERLAAAASEVRSEALAAAGRLPGAAALRVLPLWLNDADASLRRHALSRLLLTASPAATAHALRCLGDSDASVRLQAVYILERFPCTDAVPELVRLTRDTDLSCARVAIQALLRHAPFFALLAAAVIEHAGGTPGSHDEQLNAALVFKRFTDAQIVLHVRQGVLLCAATGRELPAGDLAALLKRVPESVLEEFLAVRGPEWLKAALIECDAQAEGCSAGALRRLSAACGDGSAALRERAVAALARHDTAEPGTALGPLLRDSRPDVRRMAAAALAGSGAQAVPMLQHALADVDASVRRATYESLATLLDEEAVSVWRKALRDPDVDLRLHALSRLETIRGDETETARALVEAARDEEAVVRTSAVRALVTRNVAPPSLAQAYCETLKVALSRDETKGPDTQAESIQHLSESAAYRKETMAEEEVRPAWHGEAPKPALLVALVQEVAKLLPTGALPTLVAAARHKSAIVRRAAVEALFQKGGTLTVAAFAELADTEDSDVLKRVAPVLAEAGDPRGLIPVVRAQEECRGAAEAMRRHLQAYPQARELSFLLAALKSEWPSVKRYGARELIGLDSPTVIEPLLRATKDEDVEVQLAAVEALGKFASRQEVYGRLIEILDYGDIAVREKCVQTLGVYQVKEAVAPLIRLLGNPFLRFRAEEALVRIGDRKGFLAIKRRKLRERLYGKKKAKGPLAPPGRKGKTGLGRATTGRRK